MSNLKPLLLHLLLYCTCCYFICCTASSTSCCTCYLLLYFLLHFLLAGNNFQKLTAFKSLDLIDKLPVRREWRSTILITKHSNLESCKFCFGRVWRTCLSWFLRWDPGNFLLCSPKTNMFQMVHGPFFYVMPPLHQFPTMIFNCMWRAWIRHEANQTYSSILQPWFSGKWHVSKICFPSNESHFPLSHDYRRKG